MKRILVVLLSAVLLAGCTGSGKPSDTYKEFASFLEKNELEAAYKLVDKQSRVLIDDRGGVANLTASAAHIKEHRGVKDIKVTREEQQGDSATSTALISFNDGFSGEVVNRFIKEDGKWKLVVK